MNIKQSYTYFKCLSRVTFYNLYSYICVTKVYNPSSDFREILYNTFIWRHNRRVNVFLDLDANYAMSDKKSTM